MNYPWLKREPLGRVLGGGCFISAAASPTDSCLRSAGASTRRRRRRRREGGRKEVHGGRILLRQARVFSSFLSAPWRRMPPRSENSRAGAGQQATRFPAEFSSKGWTGRRRRRRRLSGGADRWTFSLLFRALCGPLSSAARRTPPLRSFRRVGGCGGARWNGHHAAVDLIRPGVCVDGKLLKGASGPDDDAVMRHRRGNAFEMCQSCSIEKVKGKEEDQLRELGTMVCAQGCVLVQLHNAFAQDPGTFQKNWYLVVYMLLVKKNFLKGFRKVTVETLRLPHLGHVGLKKKKPLFRAQSGEDHNDQESSDCLFPGLHDDMALYCLACTCRSDYPLLACLSKKFKSLINSGYLYKLRRQIGIVEHWIYLACSLMPWEAFDPVRNRWMRLPRIPCDDCFSCADKESLAVGTQLLVFGRELTGFAVWMYNIVTNDWSRCLLMDLPRCLFGSGSSREIAIVAGGTDKHGHVLKCAEMYSSEMGKWTTLPDMNLPRKMCSGFFMDGKFYVIGGMSSNTESLTCGEEFNLETKTWRRIPNMYPGGNRATQSPPLVAVVNNQLYAADQTTNELKKYDKLNNAWNVVRPLPVRADSYNGWGLAFKACGSNLLVIGGHRGPQGEVIVLHSWCPEEGNRESDWSVLSVRERAGAFVYNCAVMGLRLDMVYPSPSGRCIIISWAKTIAQPRAELDCSA
ncbi:hypothetical protein Taro_029776 [Colocasia esculenta]|uniref:F-box/kelch-repeat protein n=1 Tax=Colocasia esculenta TaxID=4460 RepID=A0A843VU71_COLES|nr:hypothetical protein [Colocasia esculenta]